MGNTFGERNEELDRRYPKGSARKSDNIVKDKGVINI